MPRSSTAHASAPLLLAFVLPERNHLFRPTETGDEAEYVHINTSFDPALMAAVADWVLAP